jgi:hypothetical protein
MVWEASGIGSILTKSVWPRDREMLAYMAAEFKSG